MKQVTYQGTQGWLNEADDTFFPKESLRQVTYQGQKGLLNPTDNMFYEASMPDEPSLFQKAKETASTFAGDVKEGYKQILTQPVERTAHDVLQRGLTPPFQLEKPAESFGEWTGNVGKGLANLVVLPVQLPAQLAYSLIGEPLRKRLAGEGIKAATIQAGRGAVKNIRGFGEFFLNPIGYQGYKDWAEKGFEGKPKIWEAIKTAWLSDPVFSALPFVPFVKKIGNIAEKTGKHPAEIVNEVKQETLKTQTPVGEVIKQLEYKPIPSPSDLQQRGGKIFVTPEGEANIIGDIKASQKKLQAIKEPAGKGKSFVKGLPALVRKNYMIEEAENAFESLKQNNLAIEKYIADRMKQLESENIQKEIKWTPESKLQILSEILPKQSNIIGSKFMEIRNKLAEGERTGKDLLSSKETQFWDDINSGESPFTELLGISKERPFIELQERNIRTQEAQPPSPAEQTIAAEQAAQMTFERAKDILKNKVTVTEAETKAAFDFLENKIRQSELYRAKEEGAKVVNPSDYINDVTLGELQNKAAKGEDVAAHLRAGLKDETITKAQAEDAIGKILSGAIAKAKTPQERAIIYEHLKEQDTNMRDVVNNFKPTASPTLLKQAFFDKVKGKAEPKDINAWVLRKGGINYESEHWKGELRDLRGELNQGKRIGYGNRVIKSKGAYTLDELALMAKDEGYLSEATPQALLNAIHSRKKSIAQTEDLPEPPPAVKTEPVQKPRELYTYKVGDIVEINGKKLKIVSNIKNSFGEPQRVSVQPIEKVTKTIKDKTFQMSQRAYDISPWTEIMEGGKSPKRPQDILSSEAGFLRIGKEEAFISGEKTPVQKAVKGVDKFLGIISTRIGNISPEFKARLKRHAFDQAINMLRSGNTIEGFNRKTKKIPDTEKVTLTQLLHNQDFDGAKKILKKYGITEAMFTQAYNLKESITDRGIATGMKIKKDIEHHWPMRVANYEGLMKHLEETGRGDAATQIEKGIREVEKKTGRALTSEEQGKITDTMLRGWTQGKILLSDPRYAKARTLAHITHEDARFYEPFDESLRTFIYDMEKRITDNRLFGKGNQPTAADMKLKEALGFDYADLGIETREGVDASIGNLINTVRSNGKKLTNEQEMDLRSMLNSYLYPKNINPFVRASKSATYTLLLSDVSSALTQLQSEGITIGMFANTPKKFVKYYLPAWAKVITRTGLKMADIGIDSLRADFERKGLSPFIAKVIGFAFRTTDVANKEALENIIYRTYKNLAKAKDPKFMADLKMMYGKGAGRVRNEIISGEKTDDAMFAIYSTVAEYHPISALEVPQTYLDSSAWNGLMTLHTYSLRQVGIYRDKVYNEIRDGNVKEGMKNMVNLTVALIAVGMPINYIQDYIRGKDPEDLKTYFIDSALQIIGLNKYMFDRFVKSPNKVKTVVESMLPPIVNIAENIVRDTITTFEDAKETKEGEPIPKEYRTIQYGPLIGREIYNRTEAYQNRIKKYQKQDYQRRIAEALVEEDEKLADKLYDEADKKEIELSNKSIKTLINNLLKKEVD